MPYLKAVSAVAAMPLHRMTPSFSAHSLRGELGGRSLDPFLNLDDFHMSQPTFPPHPHAGFSAVTYLFEDSPGSFRNRDSTGNTQLIGPGAIHWTEAASGVIHEEVPLVPGVDSHGLQMFVNLPVERHSTAPRALHLDAEQVPAVSPTDGVRVRVLAGRFAQTPSPLNVAPAVHFFDVHLEANRRFDVPVAQGETAFAFAIAGSGLAGASTALKAHDAALFDTEAGMLTLSAGDEGLQALVGIGTPLHQPVLFSGPFALSSTEALSQAKRRYAKGEMGHLEPSF
jgi:redox-sensitive bicupin YhaK (pirin superfamily)